VAYAKTTRFGEGRTGPALRYIRGRRFNVKRMAGAVAIVVPLALVASCGARTGLVGGLPEAAESEDTSVAEAGSERSEDGGSDADVTANEAGADVTEASAMAPLSCAPGGPGMTNCGPSRESCCTSLEIPGGTFYRTYDFINYDGDGGFTLAADGGPTGEADPATISTFRLDKYDVTVGRFRQFVGAWNGGSGLEGGAGYEPEAGSGKHSYLNGGLGLLSSSSELPEAGPVTYETGWATYYDSYIAPTSANLACGLLFGTTPYGTWTPLAGSQENLPIACVNWYEAYAFCIWDGGFLPSEAEWEYAAAGGSEQRLYPWGSAAPGTANQYAIYGCYYPSESSDASVSTCTGTSNVAPVGTAPLGGGRWGQLDLAGNMAQLNLDFYFRYVDPCIDCSSLTVGHYPVARGGTFINNTWFLLSAYRGYAGLRDPAIGFRCARSP
jgi:formylglycine-generating enzyme